jgi:signal recognition particle subunit SRP54
MTGQDAVATAKAFNDRLELDGCILTKLDSDTRGGAALSLKKVTGKPIKFVGVGEKLEALEPFHPDRVAGSILGMGDMLTLVEKAQEQYDAEEAAQLEKRMAKGALTLDDFLAQMKKLQKMGSMKDILKKLPGFGGGAAADMQVDDGEIKRMEAIVLSMTPKERKNPTVIDTSRRRRIAKGSGADPQDVSGLVKSFTQMRDMMRGMAGMSMLERMKFSGKLSQMAAGGAMPNIRTKQRTATKRRVNTRDKRRARKKRR